MRLWIIAGVAVLVSLACLSILLSRSDGDESTKASSEIVDLVGLDGDFLASRSEAQDWAFDRGTSFESIAETGLTFPDPFALGYPDQPPNSDIARSERILELHWPEVASRIVQIERSHGLLYNRPEKISQVTGMGYTYGTQDEWDYALACLQVLEVYRLALVFARESGDLTNAEWRALERGAARYMQADSIESKGIRWRRANGDE